MGIYRRLLRILTVPSAALAAFATFESASASKSDPCYGITIQVQAHAREESLKTLFSTIRKNHYMANLRPAKRLSKPDTRILESAMEIQYSKHSDFQCVQAILSAMEAKLRSARLNRQLTDGIVVLTWNEKSPVLYGARPQTTD